MMKTIIFSIISFIAWMGSAFWFGYNNNLLPLDGDSKNFDFVVLGILIGVATMQISYPIISNSGKIINPKRRILKWNIK